MTNDEYNKLKADNGKTPIPTAGMAVTGNFSLNAQLGANAGKSMVISGYLYDGESIGSVNDRVDAMHTIMDRQRLRAEIPELEAKRDQMIQQMDQMRDHLTGLEAKQGLGGKLTSQDKLAMQNITTSLVKVQQEIEKGGHAIVAAKIKCGVD